MAVSLLTFIQLRPGALFPKNKIFACTAKFRSHATEFFFLKIIFDFPLSKVYYAKFLCKKHKNSMKMSFLNETTAREIKARVQYLKISCFSKQYYMLSDFDATYHDKYQQRAPAPFCCMSTRGFPDPKVTISTKIIRQLPK